MYDYITEISDDLYVIKDCVSYKIDTPDKLKAYGYLNRNE